MFKKKYLITWFFLLFVVGVQFLKFFPSVVETYYSNGLFIWTSHFLRLLFGRIPISVGDFIYIVLLLWIAISAWKTRGKWKRNWTTNLLKSVNFMAVFYFLFHLLWGFNYYRQPLFKKITIEKEYSTNELYAFTEKLIIKTNQIQFDITKNKNLKVEMPLDCQQLTKKTKNGYDKLTINYTFFKYQIPSVKKSVFSVPLSYMGFSGYLNPFTNEAQFNTQVPLYGLPMTVCHEMAHQIGYASESECNFIGYLAANYNSDLYFKYAANTLALKYCLRTIQMHDASKSERYLNKLNKGIIANFDEDKQFYLKYHSFIESGFEFFYDTFLKLNQQKEGLESYSKFIDLLINFEKRHPELM